MANRTVKFIGYTTDNATVVFSFNGTEVFNGAVSPMGDTNTPVALFEFDIDQTLSGDIASSISVSGGDVTVVALSANKSMIANDAYVSDGISYDAITVADVANEFVWFDEGANTSKKNIFIDGTEYDKGVDNNPELGAWHIDVTDGQVMVCDWVVDATPVVPPLA